MALHQSTKDKSTEGKCLQKASVYRRQVSTEGKCLRKISVYGRQVS